MTRSRGRRCRSRRRRWRCCGWSTPRRCPIRANLRGSWQAGAPAGARAAAPRRRRRRLRAAERRARCRPSLHALVELLADTAAPHAVGAGRDLRRAPVRYAPPELAISTDQADPRRPDPRPDRGVEGDHGQTWKVATYDAPGEPTIAEARGGSGGGGARGDPGTCRSCRRRWQHFPMPSWKAGPRHQEEREVKSIEDIMAMAQNVQAELTKAQAGSTRSRSRARRAAGWSRSRRPPRAGSSAWRSTIADRAVREADARGSARRRVQRRARQGRCGVGVGDAQDDRAACRCRRGSSCRSNAGARRHRASESAEIATSASGSGASRR